MLDTVHTLVSLDAIIIFKTYLDILFFFVLSLYFFVSSQHKGFLIDNTLIIKTDPNLKINEILILKINYHEKYKIHK